MSDMHLSHFLGGLRVEKAPQRFMLRGGMLTQGSS